MYIKTDGIVLREVAYQDSDKLLTVLTREYGKLTVRARGVRSSRSRSSCRSANPAAVLPRNTSAAPSQCRRVMSDPQRYRHACRRCA